MRYQNFLESVRAYPLPCYTFSALGVGIKMEFVANLRALGILRLFSPRSIEVKAQADPSARPLKSRARNSNAAKSSAYFLKC